MSARGRVCWASPASSAGALRGLTDTTTAPSVVSASQQIRYSGVVRAVTMTRSPCRTPASRRLAAAAPVWRSAAAKLSVPASLRTQMPSGSRAAASARTCGMVRDGGAGAAARCPRPGGPGQDDLAARWSRQLCCGVKPSPSRARSMASRVPNSPTSRVSVTPGKTSASSAADGRSITVSAAAMM